MSPTWRATQKVSTISGKGVEGHPFVHVEIVTALVCLDLLLLDLLGLQNVIIRRDEVRQSSSALSLAASTCRLVATRNNPIATRDDLIGLDVPCPVPFSVFGADLEAAS